MCASVRPELVSRNDKRLIERDLRLKHHIPYSLIRLLPGLKKVRLQNRLKQFSMMYKDKEFDNEPDEYQVVSQTIRELMEELGYASPIIEKVNSVMNAQLAYSEADDEYREHFIHPFQVFLLGIIIIDRHYPLFENGFSSELLTDNRTSMESTWFLASVFHDHIKPIKPLLHLARSIIRSRSEESTRTDDIPDRTELMYSIGRAHKMLVNSTQLQKNLNLWSVDPQFLSVLEEYAIKENHGVIAGLNVLDWIRNLGVVNPTDAAAALAIALHDGDYQNKRAFPMALLRTGILPIDSARNPVAFLLLWCDAIQEWGRWTHRNPADIKLLDVTFENCTIKVRLSFDNEKAIDLKKVEFQHVEGCLLNPILTFKRDLRIHPPGLGLRKRTTR